MAVFDNLKAKKGIEINPVEKHLSESGSAISQTYTASDDVEYILLNGLNDVQTFTTDGEILYVADKSKLSTYPSYCTTRIVKLTSGQSVTYQVRNMLEIVRIA